MKPKDIVSVLKIILACTAIFLCVSASVSAYNYCESGNKGSLKITSVIDNLEDNTKAFYWNSEQEISLDISIKNNREERINGTIELIFLDLDNQEIILTQDSLTEDFKIGSEKTKTITFEFELEDDLDISKYTMYVKFYQDNESATQCYQVSKTIYIDTLDFCEDNSNLKITSVKDNKQGSTNDFSWYILEEESISVTIESSLHEDDYTLELFFYDENLNEVEITKDSLVKKITLGNETKTITFEFELEDDIEQKSYGLYVRLSGENSTELRTKENKNYRYITIKDYGIKIISIEGNNNTATGSTQSYNIKIKNLGSYQNKTKIWIYNRELNISKNVEIEGLKEDQEKTISINLAFEQEGSFDLLVYSEYDYNTNLDYYETYSKDELNKEFNVVVYQKTAQESTTNQLATQATTIESNSSEKGGYSGLIIILAALAFIVIILIKIR